MGALLHKPALFNYRTWELNAFQTQSYLEFVSDNRLTVYLAANKAVRILSSFNWISDRIRYSYDGFHKQRLVDCFYYGLKISWYEALSLLSELTIDSKTILHWSSLEPNCIYDIYKFLTKISDSCSLPFSDFSSLSLLKENHNLELNTFKWFIKDRAPFNNSNSYNVINYNSYPIPTSLTETEINPISGSFNFFETNQTNVTSVLVQTEMLQFLNSDSIYFGTHGFVNANKAALVIPCLLPYERTNSYTGLAFLKPNNFNKSYHEITTILIQLYSLAVGNWAYRRKRSFRYRFIKKFHIDYNLLKDYCYTKLTYKKFSFNYYLHFFNDSPEILVSEIQRCLSY